MTHAGELLALVAAAIVIVAAAAVGALVRLARERRPYEAKKLMSPPEQEAYLRLRAALPDRLIFPQVQLSRFIERRAGVDLRWHNIIAQLSADFVVCDPDSTVTAVIEIDDKSHRRETQRRRDRNKDRACASAGIKMIRWQARRLPSVQEIREELEQAT